MDQVYLFKATLVEEEDGRWSAWIDNLPGCSTWGYTKDEALTSLQDAAELVVEDMIECGETIPTMDEDVKGAETLRVAVPT